MSGYTGIDRCTDDNRSLVEVFEEYTEAVKTAGEWFRAFSRHMIELMIKLGRRLFKSSKSRGKI